MSAFLELAPWEEINPSLNVRTWDLYKEMAWSTTLDLDCCLVRGAPFGGPIAITRDPAKVVRATVDLEKISVYSCSGVLISQFHPLPTATVVDMGWTAAEKLIVVYTSGDVQAYTLHGELADESFCLLPKGTADVVTMCSMCTTGMAVVVRTLEGGYDVYVVRSFAAPEPFRVQSTSLAPGAAPSATLVLETFFSETDEMEVLLGTQQASVVILTDSFNAEDQLLTDALGSAGVPLEMAVSPNGRYIACFGEDGTLTVMTTDFETVALSVATAAEDPPTQLAWLEDVAVAIVFDDTVTLFGVEGGTAEFEYHDTVQLVQEFDVLRVVTASSMDVLQVVPAATVKARDILSAPASMLLFVTEKSFETHDAEQTLHEMLESSALAEAVEDCTMAAAHEFHQGEQQAMLKAASYGKRFLLSYDPALFVTVCQRLRILNHIRKPDVAMPLTYRQLERLTVEVAVDRLTYRRHHGVAFKMCEFLHLRKDKVLIHWACEKVRTCQSLEDGMLRDMVTARLGRTNGVSYAEVAEAAVSAARPELAAMLLEYEPRTADQVPLLLKMKAGELALTKAEDSGDENMMYQCLLTLRTSMRDGDDDSRFISLLTRHHVAAALYVKYCRSRDRRMLRKLFLGFGWCVDAGRLEVMEAVQSVSHPLRRSKLAAAAAVFRQGVAAGEKRIQFYERTMKDTLDLFDAQVKLEEADSTAEFVGLSVSETLNNLVVLRRDKQADRLRSQQRVPDSRFWHIKIQALASAADWSALLEFGTKKKSPVGYVPFVEACLSKGERTTALRFVEKLRDWEDRFRFYVKMGNWNEAADAAIKLKDVDRLNEVGTRCSAPGVQQKVLAALKSLS